MTLNNNFRYCLFQKIRIFKINASAVYIIVGVCVIWAAIMIYRRFKATPDGKCSGCPLYTACQVCTEEAECPGCSDKSFSRKQRRNRTHVPHNKHYSLS